MQKLAQLYVPFLRLRKKLKEIHKQALKEAKESIEDAPLLNRSPYQLKLAAHHEAGHATIALRLMPDFVAEALIKAHLKGNDLYGGVVRFEYYDNILTVVETKHLLAVLYGSVVAEEKFHGRHSRGCDKDIDLATREAWFLLNHFGANGKPPIDYVGLLGGGKISHQGRLDELWVAAEQLLIDAHGLARTVLEEEQPLYRTLVDDLLSIQKLSREHLLKRREEFLVHRD